IDFVTITRELTDRNQLDELGGPAYISHLINVVPTAIHAEGYGRIVERTALRRRLLEAASDIAQLAYEEADDIDKTIDSAEQALFGVSQRRISRDMVPIGEAIRNYFDHIEYLYEHRGEPLGIPTGFLDLDKMLGGLQRSDLIIIAARPGVGKTSLMLNVALNAARKFHQRVAIFSLEMSNEQIVQRLVSGETGIDSQRLRLGDLRDEEWGLFVQATNALSDAAIHMDDTPSISALQLRTKARRLHAEFGLDLIIIDYLQLMTGESRSENRVQEISYLSRSLKALARELNVPVLVASQLSRAVEQRSDKRPVLSDLRESGCLTGETLITLADTGARVPLASLIGRSGFQVWALNEQTMKLEAARVSHAFSTGRKPVYRMVTRLGRVIRATGNHKFRTLLDWQRLDQLKIGDRIALPRQIACGTSRAVTYAEAALLGHLIGDGCTLPRHAIQYTTCEFDLAETVLDLARQVFGDQLQPSIKREWNWYQVYLSSATHLTHGVHNPITAWLADLEIFGLRSHEKHVPALMFEQPTDTIAVFLRHLWATDGCIRPPNAGRRHPAIYYATSSEQLARDVQALLLRLGINAVLRPRSQGDKGRIQYHVLVMGREDILAFADKIGAVGAYKTAALRECRVYVESRTSNTNRDVIPNEVWRHLAVPAMQQNGVTSRQLQAALGMSYMGTGLYAQNVSRERVQRLSLAVGGDEQLSALASSDVYWDEVIAIKPDGEEEVYDLTVPGLNNFIANDMVVHNSIEQDADIVMFIYRDDVYDESSERKNVAELIIAKHRNGPTGTVELYFQRNLTQFRNALKRDVAL
ncbi:MAG TPA: replicative DNA helicase, partial [Anaerolineae bacterium]|nr:replicative DNA helicase [Anaerolineae bacterium]